MAYFKRYQVTWEQGGGNVPMIHKAIGFMPQMKAESMTPMKAGALNCMHDQQAVMTNKTVRRLTPLEAERLMGLPDYWTDVEINGNPAPDSKRYKAIGNGMAVPCSDFILKRIVEVADNRKS